MATVDIVEELRTELARLRKQREELDTTIEAIQHIVSYYIAKRRREVTVADERLSNSRAIRDALYQYLASNGRPMHRRDLYKRLQAAGLFVAGDNPLNNMGAHMSNDARFKSLGDGYWGLSEWPVAPSHAGAGSPERPARRTDDWLPF